MVAEWLEYYLFVLPWSASSFCNIYINKSNKQLFKWYITKKEDIINLISYLKIYPLRSVKKNTFNLIPKYYELKKFKAHKAPIGSFLNKSWEYFNRKWLSS